MSSPAATLAGVSSKPPPLKPSEYVSVREDVVRDLQSSVACGVALPVLRVVRLEALPSP